MISHTHSAILSKTSCIPVRVDVDVQSHGLPFTTYSGLAGKIITESKERIRSALRNSGFVLPARKTGIHFSPSACIKNSSALDLAVAVGILGAYQIIPQQSDDRAFFGELRVDGSIAPIPHLFALIHAELQRGARTIIIPASQKECGVHFKNAQVIPVSTIQDCARWLTHNLSITPIPYVHPKIAHESQRSLSSAHLFEQRALEIAIRGKHSVLLYGPPGTGKSFLTQYLPTMLPPLTVQEWMDVNVVHARYSNDFLEKRPVSICLPTHTTSDIKRLVDQSISGLCIFDELHDFSLAHILNLKQLLEDPRLFIVATLNACPCGNAFSESVPCVCSRNAIANYWKKIPASIRDRFSLHLLVNDRYHCD